MKRTDHQTLQDLHMDQAISALQCLLFTTADSDPGSEIDLSEQKMLITCLISDRQDLQSLNAARDNEMRYPFLYSKQSESAREYNAAIRAVSSGPWLQDSEQPKALPDTDTTHESSMDEQEEQSIPENPELRVRNDSNYSRSSISAQYTAATADNFGSVHGSDMSDPDACYGYSLPRVSRPITAQANNLIVWHRYTELPFDLSSSDFSVKTPVLPLIQGGHLVFLTSRSGNRVMHYSVKIIKKSSSGHGKIVKSHRSSIDTSQQAVISKDEFLVLKKLSHPCLAALLYFCENQFQYYYFFPHYIFANLTVNFSMMNRLGPNACVFVICCIINTVEYLFRNCIIHRDISLKSLLFSMDGRPVLFHFDYATFHGSLHSTEAKPNYLPDLCTRAPEVISIAVPFDADFYPNCDIWGIGVLLGELLLSTKVMMRALKRKLDLNWVFSVRENDGEGRSTFGYSGVPKELMELVRSCLRKHAPDRPTIHNLMQNTIFSQFGVTSIQNVIRQRSPIDRLFTM